MFSSCFVVSGVGDGLRSEQLQYFRMHVFRKLARILVSCCFMRQPSVEENGIDIALVDSEPRFFGCTLRTFIHGMWATHMYTFVENRFG